MTDKAVKDRAEELAEEHLREQRPATSRMKASRRVFLARLDFSGK